jgi:hypothetical protein
MGENRLGSTGEHSGQELAVLGESLVSDRKDPVVDAMQTARRDALSGGACSHAQPPQLRQGNEPILLLGDPRNLPINPPRGRNRDLYSRFRPLGSGLRGCARHQPKPGGGWCVDGAHWEADVSRLSPEVREARRLPGLSENCTRLLRRGYAFGGVTTSCRPCPACRRAYRLRRLPSRAARR